LSASTKPENKSTGLGQVTAKIGFFEAFYRNSSAALVGQKFVVPKSATLNGYLVPGNTSPFMSVIINH